MDGGFRCRRCRACRLIVGLDCRRRFVRHIADEQGNIYMRYVRAAGLRAGYGKLPFLPHVADDDEGAGRVCRRFLIDAGADKGGNGSGIAQLV